MNTRFIYKWSAVGAFSAAGLLLFGVAVSLSSMNADNRQAKQVRTDELADIVKAKARQAEQAEEKVFQERAAVNWKEWKDNFTTKETGVACYHSHVFNKKERFYRITCHVGDKGKLPAFVVACDQNVCTRSESK